MMNADIASLQNSQRHRASCLKAASALPSHLHSRALHRLVQNLRQNSHSTGAQPNYLKSQKQAKDDYMKK